MQDDFEFDRDCDEMGSNEVSIDNKFKSIDKIRQKTHQKSAIENQNQQHNVINNLNDNNNGVI